jgi:hypothetical protein
VAFPGILTFRRSIKVFAVPRATFYRRDGRRAGFVAGQNKAKLRTIKNLNKEVDFRNRILAVLV